jgi:hypothetical protein
VREAWATRFNLSIHNSADLNERLMRQLSTCRSDEARRIILGITEKHTNAELTDALTVRYSGEYDEHNRLPPK